MYEKCPVCGLEVLKGSKKCPSCNTVLKDVSALSRARSVETQREQLAIKEKIKKTYSTKSINCDSCGCVLSDDTTSCPICGNSPNKKVKTRINLDYIIWDTVVLMMIHLFIAFLVLDSNNFDLEFGLYGFILQGAYYIYMGYSRFKPFKHGLICFNITLLLTTIWSIIFDKKDTLDSFNAAEDLLGNAGSIIAFYIALIVFLNLMILFIVSIGTLLRKMTR